LTIDFSTLFDHRPNSIQDKFLSRLFGIFSEEIVPIWASEKTLAPYVSKGRPTLRMKDKRHYTFDFTLKDKKTRKTYVCEQKCWFEYENYKHFTLQTTDQVDYLTGSNSSNSFNRFLELGKDHSKYPVYVDGEKTDIAGIVLIWGKVSDKSKTLVKRHYNLHDILSLEAIVNDLVSWKTSEFRSWTLEKRRWSNQLFDGICPKE
jgi:hypothetical protein